MQFARLWYELCVARAAAKQLPIRDNYPIEELALRAAWANAAEKFTAAIRKAGITYTRHGGYDYTLSNGEVYREDTPL